MRQLIVLILQTVLGLQWLEGYRTYIAAVGLFGLAVYQLATGNVDGAVQSFLAGLAALGIRGAVARTEQVATEAKLASMAAAADARPLRRTLAVVAALLLFTSAGFAQPRQVCGPNGCGPAVTVAPLPLAGPGVTVTSGSYTAAVLRPCLPGEFLMQTPHGLATCTPVAADSVPVEARRGSRLCERVRAGVVKQLVKDGATKAEAEAKASHLTDSFILETARTKRIDLPPDNLVGGWLDDHPGILAIIKLLIQLLPYLL